MESNKIMYAKERDLEFLQFHRYVKKSFRIKKSEAITEAELNNIFSNKIRNDYNGKKREVKERN